MARLTSNKNFAFGAFESLENQTIASTTIAYPMTWNTTDYSNDVYIGTGANNSKIYFPTAGTYNIQWSGQFENTNNIDQNISVWLRINGIDVVGSTGLISVPGSHAGSNGHSIDGWNYFLTFTSGQHLELVWHSTDTSVSLQSYSAGTSPTRPSTAALIFTANQIA